MIENKFLTLKKVKRCTKHEVASPVYSYVFFLVKFIKILNMFFKNLSTSTIFF